MEYYIQ